MKIKQLNSKLKELEPKIDWFYINITPFIWIGIGMCLLGVYLLQ